MRKFILLSFAVALFSCSSNDESVMEEKMEIEEPVEEPTETPSNTIESVGDVTDLELYQATPYRSEGAGYEGSDFVNLPANRKLSFSHVNGQKDTRALNKVIEDLSNIGGGEITIQKGDYVFRQVNLKSNIHITIESGTTIKIDNTIGGKRFPFAIGVLESEPIVTNVRIIGLGTPSDRPKFILEKFNRAFSRAIGLGYTKNVLIQNITIDDDLTGGTAIAFNPVKDGGDSANIPENVTVTNVGMTGGSIGYGLIQTNVGKNLFFKNLSCEGGMTCRIEAHTGRQYDLGVDNIVIRNIVNKNGKAAVLLQPHSVVNGRVIVDIARSEGSSWILFLKNGFVAPDSKRRLKGTFAASSSFTNLSMISTDDTATLSFKNYKFVPENLKPLYKTPDFTSVENDHNFSITNGVIGNESAIKGPSVAAIYIDATYPLNLPEENDIILKGEITNRLKFLDNK